MRFRSPTMIHAALLATLLAAGVSAQFSQSLPNNLLTTEGNNSSAYPWATTSPNCWHFNYDTSNFVATYPIIITGLYIRPNGGTAVVGGTHPNVEIKFASSLVDWSTTGTTTVFANVMDIDTATVYTGPVTVPAAPAATPAAWVPIGPIAPFLYDPTQGKDFIIQVRDFGPGNTAIMSAVDLHSGGSAQRYGSQTSATVLQANFSNVNIVPVVKIDYNPASGLYSGFNATPTSGHAPLTVNFTSTTFTSDPGGVTSYAWDLDGDSIIDSTAMNPSFTYFVPGAYNVTLTTTDASHAPSTTTRTAYINVSQYVLSAVTSGGGVGDFTLSGIPSLGAPTSTEGYTLVSFATSGALGTGPLFGIVPDGITFSIFVGGAQVGNPLHYLVYPGIYPDAPIVAPPGTLSFLGGSTIDFVQIGLSATQSLVFYSNVARATF